MVLDSVTALTAAAAGAMVVAGSHGGRYAAALAAVPGLRGIILHDAGIGRERAGVAGLAWLGAQGMPAAAVGHLSARIGDGADMLARGVLSVVNPAAARLGCAVGQPAAAAARLLLAAVPAAVVPFSAAEARCLLRAGPVPVWGLDSNGLVGPEHVGAIVVTGSHGGLLGGRAGSAVKAAVLAAIYNDAGIGIDQAGLGRLAALAARGIAAATVAAASARIGEARSTWADGVVSAVNAPAAACGGAPGMTVPALVDRILHHTGAAG